MYLVIGQRAGTNEFRVVYDGVFKTFAFDHYLSALDNGYVKLAVLSFDENEWIDITYQID